MLNITYNNYKINFNFKIINLIFIYSELAWLAQLVRSLPSNQMVPSSILALASFEYLCDLLFRLRQLSFSSFRGM